MTEQPDKIEGKCGCGCCEYWSDRGWLIDRNTCWADHFCRRCGYYLADDGFAYQMVRQDSVAELEKELALLNEALDGAAVDYASATQDLPSWRRLRADFLYEAQMVLDVKAREEAEGGSDEQATDNRNDADA